MTPTPKEAAKDTTNAIHNIVLRAQKYLPQFGYELVETPENADLRVAHAGQGSGEPVDVAIYHGLYPTAMGMDGVYYAINTHVIENLRTAREIIAPSDWIADVIRRDMHRAPFIVPWGVDTDEWTPGDQPHVYALWNKARVDWVSDPAPMLELAARAPHVPFLTTFGQGGPNVRTIGRQPYEVMKQHVRNAGVYLSTNVETFGIGILEALACGVPVLGFRQGAIADYLTHGHDSFLAEPGDMDGLAKGLEYVFQHRAALSANARETAKRFTWEKTIWSMAIVFGHALQRHHGPKVSVVIPCHNYAQYVGEAIESALAQKASFEYEIIVALDRCTDNSAAVVADFAQRGVKAITLDNGSLSATRNDGIRAATGEYIVLLDADDKIGNPAFLQTLSEALDTDRTLGIAFTGITIIDADGNGARKNPWPNGYDFDLQAQRRNQVPSCCMFRKEAWQRAGGFRPWFRYAEDAEFWLTVGSLGYRARHVVDDGWFHYRLHNQSASQVHRTGQIKEPDWTEFHPWTKDGLRPFAADGKPSRQSWPVRFYNQPDVTVVIPVGAGHEQRVGDALHSLEGQSHRFWECIVVNDTGHMLNLDGFPWARVFTPQKKARMGAGKARNWAASYSRAPFLVFLDADDILKPDFLELTLQTYKRTGHYAYTDWMTDDGRGNVEIHPTPEYGMDAFRQNPSLHPVTALIPRQWFKAVGGFDESLTALEDVDLFMKFLVNGYCGARVAKPLLVYNLDYGFRRANGKSRSDEFLALLKRRYGEFMEGRIMCDCVTPPKGKPRVPPTPDNAADYRETYGDVVEARYVSPFAPVSPTTFYGPATRVNYGYRAKGDVFYVWEADVTNGEGTLERVAAFELEPDATVVPPPPAFTPADIVATRAIAGAMAIPTIYFTDDLGDYTLGGEKADQITAQEFAALPTEDDKPKGLPNFEDMTGKELREYAEKNEIDITGHSKTVFELRNWIIAAVTVREA